MKRLFAVDGLRAWLAWSVVLCHCVQAAGLHQFGLLYQIFWAGPISVGVFIIISGFVITHILLEKKEPYAPYIVRRFMRIFPLFAVACVVGAFTLPLYTQGLSHVSWQSTAAILSGKILSAQFEHPWAHILAHATMLHGAIPDTVLTSSAFTLLPPAWSLSLEWQFYLIAPFAVVLAKKPSGAVVLLVACWLGAYLFFHRKLGAFPIATEFSITTFLPGAAPAFAVGIGSRLVWPLLEQKITRPSIVALCALSLMPLASILMIPFLIWIGFFSFLCADQRDARGIDALALRVYDLAFQHRFSQYWGARSYSIYLCHFPVLSILVWAIAISSPAIPQWPFLWLLSSGTFIGTMGVAILTYSCLERPGILLGHSIASAFKTRTPSELSPQIAK
jgi:peptidoglycan/LPS O-acetylase OafA/YrhL